MIRRPRRWWPIYCAWILTCAVLFFALRGLEDPSRPTGRILSYEAGQHALELARARGMDGYDVVHVARARKGEGGDEDRWIVLLDKVPHTAMRETVVMELRSANGELIVIRRPK